LDVLPVAPLVGLRLTTRGAILRNDHTVSRFLDAQDGEDASWNVEIGIGNRNLLLTSRNYQIELQSNNLILRFTDTGFQEVAAVPFEERVTALWAAGIDFLEFYVANESVTYDRWGVLFEVAFSDEEPPPGLRRLADLHSTIWKTVPRKRQYHVLIPLSEGEERLDQCHHSLVQDSTAENPSQAFRFDWQRLWTKRRALSRGDWARISSECTKEATRYFDDFGSGGGPDAD